jgi:hypothetical protein
LTTPVDENQFTILEEAETTWGAHNVNVKILGESHMITVTKGADCIQEICACVDIQTKETDVVHVNGMLCDQPHTSTHDFSFLKYHFQHDCKALQKNRDALSESINTAKNKYDVVISHTFANPPQSVDFPAITFVGLHIGEKVEIYTVHTYPNEDLFVETFTTISSK